MEIKKCSDCKYAKGARLLRYGLETGVSTIGCKHPKAFKKFDPIDGSAIHYTCGDFRNMNWLGCGKKARYFEPKV